MSAQTGIMTHDANQSALSYLRRERAHVEPRVYEDPMPDIQYPSLIPVDTSAPAWVDAIEFTSMTKAGQAEWHQGDSDDIPLAQVATDLHQSGVHLAAIGYGYGYEEINKASTTANHFLHGRRVPRVVRLRNSLKTSFLMAM